MGKMVRKQVYINAGHDDALKRRAAETGMSEAEIIRASLDLLLQSLARGERPGQGGAPAAPGTRIREASAQLYQVGERTAMGEKLFKSIEEALSTTGRLAARDVLSGADGAAWAEERAFMERRSLLEAKGGERGWTREELYDEGSL